MYFKRMIQPKSYGLSFHVPIIINIRKLKKLRFGDSLEYLRITLLVHITMILEKILFTTNIYL